MTETRTLERGDDWAATLCLVPHGADREREGRVLAARLLGEDARARDLVLRGVHPDLIELVPPPGKERIGIDQVRDVIRRGQFSPVQGKRKVCLVSRAETLTTEAENALLKVLEEPTRDLVFLLLAVHPADVLPTILSRSRVVRLPSRSSRELLERLSRAGYGEEESRYLLAAARSEEEVAPFVTRREAVLQLREKAGEQARSADAAALARMATGPQAIERYEAVLALVARLVEGETALCVIAARVLAQSSREEVLRFLEDLLYRSFELVLAALSPSYEALDPHVTALGRKVDQEHVLDLAAAIGKARQAVEAYTPAEAVLLSLFIRAGGMKRG